MAENQKEPKYAIVGEISLLGNLLLVNLYLPDTKDSIDPEKRYYTFIGDVSALILGLNRGVNKAQIFQKRL